MTNKEKLTKLNKEKLTKSTKENLTKSTKENLTNEKETKSKDKSKSKSQDESNETKSESQDETKSESQHKTKSESQDETNKKDEVFWSKNPYVLFKRNNFLDVFPKSYMNLHQKLNALSRLTIYLTLIFYLLFKKSSSLTTGLTILVTIVFIYYILDKKSKQNDVKEKFTNADLYQKYKHNYTNPSVNNPLMNVGLTEIEDNPHRLRAAPSFNSAVNEEINEKTKDLVQNNFKEANVKDKLFNDLGDKLQFEQSMRQFYTTSSTTVPNNQNDFAQFCYGNMASCKDGDVKECVKNNYRHTII